MSKQLRSPSIAQAGKASSGAEKASSPQGNASALVNRLGGGAGLDTSGLDVVQGPQGESGLDAGAIATITGNRIFFGMAFEALDETDQRKVVAHELAHWAQANTDSPVGSVESVESDADQAAQDILAGRPPGVEVGVQDGESYNFELPSWSDVTDAVGSAAGAVLDFGLETIGSAEELLSAVLSLGEFAALRLIDTVLANKTEIALGLLLLSPPAGIAVYILTHVSPQQIRDFLTSIDPARAAMFVGLAVTAGAVTTVAAGLFLVNPTLSLTIMRELGAPVLVLLWQEAPQDFRTFCVEALTEIWPAGLGFALDVGLGATFGYPIYLGFDAFFEVAHYRAGEFKLKRGGVLTEAFDTGVGAGGFVGLGGGRDGSNEGAVGIGAEAGAQFQAGLKQCVYQEFDFPVVEDSAFASFILTALTADMSASMAMLSPFSDQLRAVNPMSYNTKTKFEFKVFAEGNASASAGVRTGGENTQSGRQNWDNNQGSADTGQTPWWSRWMRASVFGSIMGEAGVAFEIENQEFTTDDAGVRVPSVMKVEASGEANAALTLVHAIPVISSMLPAGIDFAGGAGIKVAWTLTGNPGDELPTISDPTYSLYSKTGAGLDRYEGAGSETTISVGNMNEDTFSSLESFLSNIQGGSEFKRRFSVGSTLGRKYTRAMQRQGGFNTMLPASYRNYGLRIEGYIDLESELTADMIRGVFRGITDIVDGYTEGGEPLQQLYVDIMRLFSTGEGPAHVMTALESIINHILSGLKKLHFHGLVGLGIAGGGQVSGGAKVRLEGHAMAQVTVDQDLLQYLAADGQQVTLQDIRDLMSGAAEAASAALELEPTG